MEHVEKLANHYGYNFLKKKKKKIYGYKNFYSICCMNYKFIYQYISITRI